MSLRNSQQSLDRRRPRRFLREQQELHGAPGRAPAARRSHHHNQTRGGFSLFAGRSLFV